MLNAVESTIARNSDWVLPITCRPRDWSCINKSIFGTNASFIYFMFKTFAKVRNDIDKKSYEKYIKNLKNLPKAIRKSES